MSVKNEKWNLENHISVFSVTLKGKCENQAEVFRNFLNFLIQFLKKTNGFLGTRIIINYKVPQDMFKNVPHVKKNVARMQVKHLLNVNSLEIIWCSFLFLTLNKLFRKEETCFSYKVLFYLF